MNAPAAVFKAYVERFPDQGNDLELAAAIEKFLGQWEPDGWITNFTAEELLMLFLGSPEYAAVEKEGCGMSETKHTEGPWQLDRECLFDDGISATISGKDGIPILEIFPSKLNSSLTQWTLEQEGNAYLVSAAPDLLESLKALMAYPQSVEKRAAAELKANAAINRAEGR